MAQANAAGRLQGFLAPVRAPAQRPCNPAARWPSSCSTPCGPRLMRQASPHVISDDAVATVDSSDGSGPPGAGLSTEQVHSLLETICEETDIMEMRLEVGDYELNVRRRAGVAHAIAAATPTAAPPAVNGAAGQPATAPGTATIEDSLDEEATMSMNECLVFIESPRVGKMRRGLYNKAGRKVGKGPQIGDLVKKGSTLCFIEQLGTFCPVLAPQQGELSAFMAEDGAPVEYRQPVVEMAPYFGGHIIGDMKYA
ncbi:unnamed protein product [Ostreobium quekettii]|uniref:Lipoyl-binding domain-containing protein n=1 Tax=Ostreobium quekettii TaxID=121088 RepID=A0A8S1JD12_9CHLO|nr:unnamed protein product [Ostreobium quekettii]|eukprot:evm.model.scf_842.2 EVM.evm.TU.scf_842.2   scf_842:7425-8186(+)